MSRQMGSGFPLLALLIGGIGTIAAGLGILANTAPEVARRIWPLLAQSTVANAMIVMGAVLIAVEMILILQWLRRRRQLPPAPPSAAPVTHLRDRG